MKEVNKYYTAYQDNQNKVEFLKYGILNDYGVKLQSNKEIYNEENIIKHKCNSKKTSSK